MTPAARLAAAIDILDHILTGEAAEKALTNWARRSRFAGSKDRAAVRDHVFDALRCLRSCAHLGGGQTGRGLILGLLRRQGMDPSEMFTGTGHAPAPLSPSEMNQPEPPSGNVALDCPDWIAPRLQASLGDDFAPICHALQSRAPVFLRVNALKASRDQAAKVLADEGIQTRPHPLSPSALQVTQNPRRVQQSAAYQNGLVELQDAASQAVVDLLPLQPGSRVLDYCAGGGGKVLAMASRMKAGYFAHDANPKRMQTIPERAKRAGASVTILQPEALKNAPAFDLVLCDVPCSGSGSWRRSPAAKWDLRQSDLDDLRRIQAEILDNAAALLTPAGVLAYSTCSLLDEENFAQIDAFLTRNPGWSAKIQRKFTPLDGGDGFFVAILTRE
ncbi:MAG: SAM-dependent methyltransferase [Rhodobacterales bacterium]|nr:MAG: SAM-dependent methyltransferase [Rhodobacterales bacterium]